MKSMIGFILCLWSVLVWAHKPSDSYLSLTIGNNKVAGHWDIALRDLDFALGLDNNGDNVITWGELRAKSMEITEYAFSRLQLESSGQACPPTVTGMKVDQHTDGKYAVLFFSGGCAATGKLAVGYGLFAGLDTQHRGLLNLNHENKTLSAVLAPDEPPRVFDLSAAEASGAQILDFIQEGVWHIWIGFDHMLFLFSLLIPSVMVYRNAGWRPVSTFNEALWDVFKVVTAFTLAHSITLGMAVLGYIELPFRWVESAIAASVILAALNNIVPVFSARRAMLAFGFGLIHGFGFASVLSDLGLPESSKLASLLGFNLGVEFGQIALVLVFLPVSYKLSRASWYESLFLKACSLGVASVASAWFLERAFDISIQL